MCGICGIVGPTTNSKDKIKAMVGAMHHRGPNDYGVLVEKNIALGMTRLAILDLSREGHQPMPNRQKNIWIIYNGEMYNFVKERKILEKKGYWFHSKSDTEVVLLMYEEYGDDFLPRMRGMFALAIYDQRPGPGKEKILLARDQLGIKPLLYCQQGKNLIFASEIKTILASGLVKKDVEPDSLRKLLTYGSVTQPATIIKNVKMLLPSHQLIFQNGAIKFSKYWQLATGRYPQLSSMSYNQQKIVVKKELEKIVSQQMVSDVPIGAFLSGGVDSSLLVAIMSKFSKNKVKTFSVGFGQEGKNIDESDDALKIAKFLKTDHLKVTINDAEVRSKVSQIAKALDQPSVDGFNAYFVSQTAKKAVTVAISGTGGDELFAGYPWFANMMNFSHKRHQPKLAEIVSRVFNLKMTNPLMLTRARHFLADLRNQGFLAQFARQYQIFGPILTSDLLSKDYRQESSIGCSPTIDLAFSDELPYANPVDRVSALCLRGYTQNQLLRDIDATSMSHSLEVRVPFLDHILTDMALSLPIKAKLAKVNLSTGPAENLTYRELGAKKILIDIGRNLLPKNMDQQKKRGFALPFDHWLKGVLKDVLIDTLSKKSVKKRGFFNPIQTETYLKNYLKGTSSWSFVWLLMITELWAREVIDE